MSSKLMLGMIFVEIHKHKASKKAFGDAHWASMREIKKMGLLDNKDGLIIGEKQGPSHPERKTHCWNPLDLIDKNSPELIADIDLIVEILISYSNDKDSMWIYEARALTKGLVLWLMNSGRPFTIGELTKFIKGTPNFVAELAVIRDGSVDKDGAITIHPIAFNNINNFIEKAEKEQSGVKSTITARLNIWDDPLIQHATSKSDFDSRQMRKNRMTIYLGIPINQLDRLAPLMNFFIQLFLNAMTKNLPKENEPYKVLVILDEFCANSVQKKKEPVTWSFKSKPSKHAIFSNLNYLPKKNVT